MHSLPLLYLILNSQKFPLILYLLCGRYIQMKLKAASNLQAELCVSLIVPKSMRFLLNHFLCLKSYFSLILFFMFWYHMTLQCSFLFVGCLILPVHSFFFLLSNKLTLQKQSISIASLLAGRFNY